MNASVEQLAADRLLTSEQAAELLGIPVGALRRYASRGEVPSVKLGHSKNAHRFYDRETILALRRRARVNGNGGIT